MHSVQYPNANPMISYIVQTFCTIFALYFLQHNPISHHLNLLSQKRPLHGPHPHALPGIKLGPHIEIEARPALAVGSSGVEIDHVVDAGAAAVDDPVVAVKGGAIAEDGVDAGGRGHAVHFVGEGFEFRAAASRGFVSWRWAWGGEED